MTALKRYVQLPIGEFELDYLLESAEALRGREWGHRAWFARPALVDRKSGNSRLHVGHNYDPNDFEVQLDGWNHDHCEVCWQTLSAANGADSLSEGYFDGASWVCSSCYRLFIEPDDPGSSLAMLRIIER